jgi:HNH endonuclease
MEYYHIHHIIPKHMGGSNDPSNLIKLTVKDHAEAHRQLWETYKKEEDKIAWRMLSGQITAYEASMEALKNSSRKTCLQRNKENNPMWNEKSVKKCSESVKKFWENNPEKRKQHGETMSIINSGKKRTEKQRENYRKCRLGKNYPTAKRKCCCLGCYKETTTQAFSRCHLKKCFE